MRGFLAELKRRHVYRVAVVYAAAVWLLVQIADIVMENFNLPDRIMQLFIVCAALGFPLALIAAWVYEISPAGIRRTPAADSAVDSIGDPESGIDAVATAADERPGIVVLPFDNFSGDLNGEIVCNGFTEDLTTLLAHIPDFFVISRKSLCWSL